MRSHCARGFGIYTASHFNINLVNHVQQVGVQAVIGLADVLAASPVMTGSAAALLMTVLLQHRRTRRAGDSAFGGSSAAPL